MTPSSQRMLVYLSGPSSVQEVQWGASYADGGFKSSPYALVEIAWTSTSSQHLASSFVHDKYSVDYADYPPIVMTSQVLNSTEGNGLFSRMMKWAVALAFGTDGIEVALLSYLVPCVGAEWDLSSLQQGSLTASVFAGQLVSIYTMKGLCWTPRIHWRSLVDLIPVRRPVWKLEHVCDDA